MDLSPRQLALYAARQMYDKGAEDLVVLELPEDRRALFDYVVIGNGRSERQVRTLVDEVYHFCKRNKIAHFPAEGEAGWRVIDCHEVVVHGLLPELRDHYRIEGLWDAPIVVDHEAEWADLPDLSVSDTSSSDV